MGGIITIVSIVLGVLLLIGFLIGFIRSWKKATIRAGILLGCFLLALLLSSKVAALLISKFVKGLVLTAFGFTVDFEQIASEIAGDMSSDLLADGSTMTKFATALLNIAVRMVSFIAIFLVLAILSLIVYAIVVAIVSSKNKKKAVGNVQQKGWQRLIGGAVGVVGALIVCLALFTPVFGVMNVCDKFISTDSNTATAAAYSGQSYVGGKFYTDNDKIGKIEGYMQKYYDLRNEYKNSFAGIVLTYTGVDAIGKGTFNNLSTVNQDGLNVNLTQECVTMANVYNAYKENFVENEFDITTNKGVDALKNMYTAAKDSEVLKSLVLEVVPKLAERWEEDRAYLGIKIPVTGDLKDLTLDLIEVFNTDSFDVVDENVQVMFEALKVANNNGVIAAAKESENIADAIKEGTFVKDEILTLAQSSKMKQVLPDVINTVLGIAYREAVGGTDELTKPELTQQQLANINWNKEAESMQKIVTDIFEIVDSTNLTNDLGNIGGILDASRSSLILSQPVHKMIYDYVDNKVEDSQLGDAKQTLLTSIEDDWDDETYSYETLFDTISTTAQIAESLNSDMQNMDFTALTETIENLIKNDTEGNVKDTILTAIETNNVLENLIEDATLAQAFKDMIVTVVNGTTAATVDKDLLACQVIVNIISHPSTGGESVLTKYPVDPNSDVTSADIMIETLTNSEVVMGLAITEADKVSSPIKTYTNALSASDKTAIGAAIDKLETGTNKTALQKLFHLI